MLRTSKFAFALIAGLAMLAAPALAQQNNIVGAAKITNTARVPGTVTQVGTDATTAKGVYCVFSQTADVGGPSTVISVEVEDVLSGTWQTMGTAAAFAATAGTKALLIYPGAVATSVPTDLAVFGLHIPSKWRLKQVITGGTSSTGTANCDLLN